MITINERIQQLRAPEAHVRIAAARELAERGADARPAWGALWERYRVTEDREELRAMTEAQAAVNPVGLEGVRYMRTRRKERESYARLAKGLSAEEVWRKIGDLVWSFEGHEPPAQFLIDQGRYMVEIGLAVPEVMPDLIQLLVTTPNLRGQMGLVLGCIGRKG